MPPVRKASVKAPAAAPPTTAPVAAVAPPFIAAAESLARMVGADEAYPLVDAYVAQCRAESYHVLHPEGGASADSAPSDLASRGARLHRAYQRCLYRAWLDAGRAPSEGDIRLPSLSRSAAHPDSAIGGQTSGALPAATENVARRPANTHTIDAVYTAFEQHAATVVEHTGSLLFSAATKGTGPIPKAATQVYAGTVVQLWPRSVSLARLFVASLRAATVASSSGPCIHAPMSVLLGWCGIPITVTSITPLFPTPVTTQFATEVADVMFHSAGRVPNTAAAPSSLIEYGIDGRCYVVNVVASFVDRLSSGKAPSPDIVPRIRQLATSIERMTATSNADAPALVKEAHTLGVPLRHLGDVYRCLASDAARTAVLTEMVARSARDLIAATLLRSTPPSSSSSALDAVLRVIMPPLLDPDPSFYQSAVFPVWAAKFGSMKPTSFHLVDVAQLRQQLGWKLGLTTQSNNSSGSSSSPGQPSVVRRGLLLFVPGSLPPPSYAVSGSGLEAVLGPSPPPALLPSAPQHAAVYPISAFMQRDIRRCVASVAHIDASAVFGSVLETAARLQKARRTTSAAPPAVAMDRLGNDGRILVEVLELLGLAAAALRTATEQSTHIAAAIAVDIFSESAERLGKLGTEVAQRADDSASLAAALYHLLDSELGFVVYRVVYSRCVAARRQWDTAADDAEKRCLQSWSNLTAVAHGARSAEGLVAAVDAQRAAVAAAAWAITATQGSSPANTAVAGFVEELSLMENHALHVASSNFPPPTSHLLPRTAPPSAAAQTARSLIVRTSELAAVRATLAPLRAYSQCPLRLRRHADLAVTAGKCGRVAAWALPKLARILAETSLGSRRSTAEAVLHAECLGVTAAAYLDVMQALCYARRFGEALQFGESALSLVREYAPTNRGVLRAIQRSMERAEAQDKRKPEVVIQEAWRGVLQRKRAARSREVAVSSIQCTGRGYIERREMHGLRALSALQRVARGYVSRQAFFTTDVVTRLQRVGVGYSHRVTLSSRLAKLRRLVSLVNRTAHGRRARFFVFLKHGMRYHLNRLVSRIHRGADERTALRILRATCTLQRVGRALFTAGGREPLGIMRMTLRTAAVWMQRIGRAHRERFRLRVWRETRSATMQQTAALLLQRHGRGLLLRILLFRRSMPIKRSRATLLLSRAFAGYFVRRRIASSSSHTRYVAVVRIQRVGLGYAGGGRRLLRRLFMIKQTAAITMTQAALRMRASRDVRLYQAVAAVMQVQACSIVQRVMRGATARLAVELAGQWMGRRGHSRRASLAAIAFETAQRALGAGLVQRLAGECIGRVVAGAIGRHGVYASLRRCAGAASVVQRCGRSYLVRRELKNVCDASRCLLRVAAGFAVRHGLRRQWHAIGLLCRIMRGLRIRDSAGRIWRASVAAQQRRRRMITGIDASFRQLHGVLLARSEAAFREASNASQRAYAKRLGDGSNGMDGPGRRAGVISPALERLARVCLPLTPATHSDDVTVLTTEPDRMKLPSLRRSSFGDLENNHSAAPTRAANVVKGGLVGATRGASLVTMGAGSRVFLRPIQPPRAASQLSEPLTDATGKGSISRRPATPGPSKPPLLASVNTAWGLRLEPLPFGSRRPPVGDVFTGAR